MPDATPAGVRIVAFLPDGSEVNVTDGVMTLYDLVLSSMDWGSGFVTIDDAEPVVHIAQTCGFAEWEEAAEYVETQRHSIQQREFLKTRNTPLPHFDAPHDHVYSAGKPGVYVTGRCLWPQCTQREGDSK